MTKSEARQKFKVLRNQLTTSAIDDASIAIANQLLPLQIWHYDYYHIYLSIKSQNEINTDYILNILSGKDKHIVVSKTDFENYEMTHFLLTDNTRLVKNSYGIPEPIDGISIAPTVLQVVFVPLLTFDNSGHRVGYGKGFYDTFLKSCSPNCIKIGLSLFDPIDAITNVQEHDVSLDYCVTPQRIYEF